MRRVWIAVVLALAGCEESDAADGDGGSSGADESGTEGGETEADTDTDTDADLPSPYTTDTDGGDPEEVPTMGPDEAISSAVAGLEAFVFLRPNTVGEAFEAMAVFEEGCPEEFQDIDEPEARVLQWYTEGCTTSAGLSIRGGGRFESYVGRAEDDRVSDGFVLSAEGGTFRLENGNRWLQFSGYLGVDTATYPEGSDGFFGFFGEASADNQTAMGSPLLDGSVSGQGEMYAGSFEGYRYLGGSGALTGNALGDTRAMSFDDILLVAQGCGSEPAGSLAVRDDEGFWHDIVFDAATMVDDEYEWDANACDGCGAYLAGGVESGEACVPSGALDDLMTWEEIPW